MRTRTHYVVTLVFAALVWLLALASDNDDAYASSDDYAGSVALNAFAYVPDASSVGAYVFATRYANVGSGVGDVALGA